MTFPHLVVRRRGKNYRRQKLDGKGLKVNCVSLDSFKQGIARWKTIGRGRARKWQ